MERTIQGVRIAPLYSAESSSGGDGSEEGGDAEGGSSPVTDKELADLLDEVQEDDDRDNTTSSVFLNKMNVTKRNGVAVGIGGKDGVVYDVNKLKRNLVQETVRNYKRDLWNLLGEPKWQQNRIQNMLSSICQVNPVSTTTDSNLLEGTWTLVLKSSGPSNVLYRPIPNTSIGQNDSSDGAHGSTLSSRVSLVSGSPRRTFVLEDLDEEEDPFVLDTRRFNQQLYDVLTITTQSIILEPNRKPNDPLMCIQVLYLDVDFLICSEERFQVAEDGTVPAMVDLNKEPYLLYTKSPQWIARTQRLKRKMRRLGSFAFKLRQHVMPKRASTDSSMLNQEQQRQQQQQQQQDSIISYRRDKDSSLRVLKFGLAPESQDNAWEGEEDPFVHLTADERQKTLKSLSYKEIQKLHERHKAKAMKLRRKQQRVYERVKEFKKVTDTMKEEEENEEDDIQPLPPRVFRTPQIEG